MKVEKQSSIKPGDTVKFCVPANEREGKARFQVLDIDPSGMAEIQLVCAEFIKPIEVVHVSEIEIA